MKYYFIWLKPWYKLYHCIIKKVLNNWTTEILTDNNEIMIIDSKRLKKCK